MKEKVDFSWEGTGDLSIEVMDNLYANIRYRPSQRFVEETLAKLRKTPANASKPNGHTNSKVKVKGLEKALKRLYGGSMKEGKPMNASVENINGEYGLLSQRLQAAYRSGDFGNAADVLERMASVLHSEAMYTDELKALLLSAYFKLSGLIGAPNLPKGTIESMRSAFGLSGLSMQQYDELFFDTIRSDTLPNHALTVKGFYRVASYCLLGLDNKTEEVLKYLQK